MTATDHGHPDFRRGLVWGLAIGLVLAVPAGAALKAAGYPSVELYVWWAVLGVAVVVTLVWASLVAVRRAAWAGGLAVGAMTTMAIAPLLVVIDILGQSA
jgi:hypothetical protein